VSKIDYAEAVAYNGREIDQGDFTPRMIARLVEEWQKDRPPLKIDGKCGEKTQESILLDMPSPEAKGHDWKPWDGPLERQPRNRTEVYELFGTPGPEGSSWYKQNVIEVQGRNALPGVPPKWYVKLHEDVEPYAREGLRRAQISSSYEIERCGGFNYRHAQYDETKPLSYHSWGIAIDIDPGRNYAKRFKKPDCAPVPWSPEWTDIWPHGLDEPFVRAMESCGWSWGGWWKNFCDPMHLEFVGKHSV
jgi:hypothetical protein